VEAVVKAVDVPVTVKCRLGWDKGNINVLDFTKRMEDCGAAMITVHGRTRSMLYSGTADWDTIAKVKRQLSVPVIANGDIVDGKTAYDCRRRTGADGIIPKITSALPPGTYYLTETNPPDGCKPLEGDLVFTITREDGFAEAKMRQYEALLKSTQYEDIFMKTRRCQLPVFRELPAGILLLTHGELAACVRSILEEEGLGG
jgi:hypothetical protein